MEWLNRFCLLFQSHQCQQKQSRQWHSSRRRYRCRGWNCSLCNECLVLCRRTRLWKHVCGTGLVKNISKSQHAFILQSALTSHIFYPRNLALLTVILQIQQDKGLGTVQIQVGRRWWACLASTLGNCINCTHLFKLGACLSTSYYYHSILTTPLTLQLPPQDKELPKHVQSALAIMTRIAWRSHFVHKPVPYWQSLSFLEASDFNHSIFPQVLPVSLRWKWLEQSCLWWPVTWDSWPSQWPAQHWVSSCQCTPHESDLRSELDFGMTDQAEVRTNKTKEE